jgi:hypothetical protein
MLGLKRISLAHDRVKMRASVNTAMELLSSMQGREMLIYERLLPTQEDICFISSRVLVTIEGVWIGEYIY